MTELNYVHNELCVEAGVAMRNKIEKKKGPSTQKLYLCRETMRHGRCKSREGRHRLGRAEGGKGPSREP